MAQGSRAARSLPTLFRSLGCFLCPPHLPAGPPSPAPPRACLFRPLLCHSAPSSGPLKPFTQTPFTAHHLAHLLLSLPCTWIVSPLRVCSWWAHSTGGALHKRGLETMGS